MSNKVHILRIYSPLPNCKPHLSSAIRSEAMEIKRGQSVSELAVVAAPFRFRVSWKVTAYLKAG